MEQCIGVFQSLIKFAVYNDVHVLRCIEGSTGAKVCWGCYTMLTSMTARIMTVAEQLMGSARKV